MACTGTVEAYERLIQGETDLIFAAAPSQEQLDLAQRRGMALHLTPIGREAFVFFVNSENPVEGLSLEQVRGIYSGALTNWSQVGGENQSIRPFQRMENSGSQSALLRLMEGLPLIEPEKEDRVADMGGIISQVADYRNYANAIGFSFRFYSTRWCKTGTSACWPWTGSSPPRRPSGTGATPSPIPSTPSPPPPRGSPPPRRPRRPWALFLNWILSPEGQDLVEESGYVSLT